MIAQGWQVKYCRQMEWFTVVTDGRLFHSCCVGTGDVLGVEDSSVIIMYRGRGGGVRK